MMPATPAVSAVPAAPTLSDAMWPESASAAKRWLRAVLLVLGGSAILAVSAQVSVPLQPVPLTMQPFAVMLLAAALGPRLAAAAVLLYLFEGAVLGLPVFAGFRFGLPVMLGPTGGYLVGFVFAAAAIGWLAERGWDRRVASTVAAMLLGLVIIYGMGVAWLSTLIGLDKAAAVGVVPFVYGDLVKAALAALVLPGAWRLVR